MSTIKHQDNFSTNVTTDQIAGVTTTPIDSLPSVAAPFYIALDATNINGKYEVVYVTSKTATNVNHAATTYAHTTAEEVRMIVPAAELDNFAVATEVPSANGWIAYSTVTPTYTSADDPTYTITFAAVDLTSTMGVGMRVKFTNNATTFYGIITAIAFSTNTVVTLYGGTDYDVANSAITAFYYSNVKAPLGFPLDPLKWTVTVTDTTQRTGAGTASTWLNVGTTNSQIAIPIGVWDVSYQVNAVQNRTSQGTGSFIKVALSDANNTASNLALVSYHRYESGAANSSDVNGVTMSRRKTLTFSVKATYYLNMVSDADGSWTYENALGSSLIEARCSYL